MCSIFIYTYLNAFIIYLAFHLKFSKHHPCNQFSRWVHNRNATASVARRSKASTLKWAIDFFGMYADGHNCHATHRGLCSGREGRFSCIIRNVCWNAASRGPGPEFLSYRDSLLCMGTCTRSTCGRNFARYSIPPDTLATPTRPFNSVVVVPSNSAKGCPLRYSQ